MRQFFILCSVVALVLSSVPTIGATGDENQRFSLIPPGAGETPPAEQPVREVDKILLTNQSGIYIVVEGIAGTKKPDTVHYIQFGKSQQVAITDYSFMRGDGVHIKLENGDKIRLGSDYYRKTIGSDGVLIRGTEEKPVYIADARNCILPLLIQASDIME